MDPEILQLLFQNARNRNKNVSGVLGNLDNPLLAYLAGAYDPTTQIDDGGTSQVWNTYYGNQNYPELQPVLDIIAQGGDQYQAQAALDAAVAEGGTLGPFSYETARSLVNDAYKEVSEGGRKKKSDVFSKAGLPSPLDVYTEQTVPLNSELVSLLAGARPKAERLGKIAGTAASGVARQKKALELSKESLKNYVDSLQKAGGTGTAADIQLRKLREDIGKRGYVSAEELASLENKYSPSAAGLDPVYEQMYRKRLSRVSDKKPSVSKKQMDEYATSLREANILQGFANKQAELERATRRGALRAYEEMGKTPLGDSLSAMLRFTANSSGK